MEILLSILLGILIPLSIVFFMGPHKIIRCTSCTKFMRLALIYAHDQELDKNLYEIHKHTENKDSYSGLYFKEVEKRLFCKRCRVTDKLIR